MARPLYTNNAASSLAAGITSTQTTIQLSDGMGNLFPTPVGGDYFYATIVSVSLPVVEIVKCTARSGDYLTVVRGEEGTVPLPFNINDGVQLRITAAGMNFLTGQAVTSTEEEAQTATQGQTVFTLVNFDYAIGTNNLAVFVNGSKQISGVNYSETNVNTVTFNTGLNVGDIVEFLVGVSVASGTLFANDVQYNEGSTGAITRTVASKLQESVSVKDFGAVGDGVVDDTDAIQAAIDSGSKTIYFPQGTYSISSSLLINNNGISLIGSGMINGTTIVPTAFADAAIKVATTTDVSVFIIENMTVLGNSTNTSGLVLGTTTYSASVVTVSNCRFRLFNGTNASGITLVNSYWGSIKGGSIFEYNYYGIYIPTGAVITTLEISENVAIENSSLHGYFASYGASVDAVIFNGISIELSQYSAIYSTAATTNLIIQNCYFELNCQNAAALGTIVVNSLDAATYHFATTYIDNCQFHAIAYGVQLYFDYVKNCVVSNNNGCNTITTTANSDVYFENNQGHAATDMLALYKTLLGIINAYEREPSTGYWQNYSSQRFSLSDTHLAVQQTTKPTAIVIVGGAGTGATVVVANGSTDTQGRIDFTTGTSPAAGASITVTFNKTYTTTPLAVLVSYGSYVASAPTMFVVGTSATTFNIGFNGTPIAGLQYINYVVIGGQ